MCRIFGSSLCCCANTGENTRRHARGNSRICRLTSTVNKRVFLGITETNTKALCDVTRKVKRTVVQKLVGDLDHAAELICRKRLNAEVQVGFLNCCAFFNPGSRTVIHRNRNGTGAGIGAHDMRKGTENVVFLESLNQSAFEFIRNRVSALFIGTNGQTTKHFIGKVTTHHIPECIVILFGFGWLHRFLTGSHFCKHRSRSRCRELSIHFHLIFQTLDLFTESLHVIGHLVVLLYSGCLNKAIFITMFLQECLSVFPELVAFVS